MKRRVFESIDRNGVKQIYFDGLETWEDYEAIIKAFERLGNAIILDELDAIYLRKRTMKTDEFEFVLMFDDHVGNYVYAADEKKHELLRSLSEQVAESIN